MTNDQNDFSSDEIRRQLRESDTEHNDAMPAWNEALEIILDPETNATEDEKAQFLGLPARRAFLVGGSVLAGSAFLAACKKPKEQTTVTGSTLPKPSVTTTTAPGSQATNQILLRTAQSIEVLAVNVYQKAIDSGLVKTSSLVDMMKVFQSQHREHGASLDAPIKAAGGTVVTTANEYLMKNTVDKALAELTDEKSVLALAREVETIAAQTYTKASYVLTLPLLRQASMSIGAVEARHIAVLNAALGYTVVPLATMPTRLAINPKGYVTA
jgi:hypothetical protein